jgi:hypothetical protein
VKVKTVLVASIAGGVGYVLGTRAGRAKFEEIRAKADRLAHSPQVQDVVTKAAEQVKKNADLLPDPVAQVVSSVADSALRKQ